MKKWKLSLFSCCENNNLVAKVTNWQDIIQRIFEKKNRLMVWSGLGVNENKWKWFSGAMTSARAINWKVFYFLLLENKIYNKTWLISICHLSRTGTFATTWVAGSFATVWWLETFTTSGEQIYFSFLLFGVRYPCLVLNGMGIF